MLAAVLKGCILNSVPYLLLSRELRREAFTEAQLPHRLTVLSDGEAAANYIADQARAPDAFDLILLDLNLPRIDGLSLLDKIRETAWCASIPVIVTTSSSSPREKERLHEFAGAQLIIKPSDLDGFMEIGFLVRQALEQGQRAVS